MADWISVKDRMPTDDNEVLVYINDPDLGGLPSWMTMVKVEGGCVKVINPDFYKLPKPINNIISKTKEEVRAMYGEGIMVIDK